MIRYFTITVLLLAGPACMYAQSAKITAQQCYNMYNDLARTRDTFYLDSKPTMWQFCLDSVGMSKDSFFIAADIPFILNQIKHPALTEWKPGQIKSATIIPDDELNLIFGSGVEDGWSSFYKKYSLKGFYTYSPPFFSVKGDHCIVYITSNCGGLCGAGEIYYCERRDNKWVVISHKQCWVS
jgi:hypothetical protein